MMLGQIEKVDPNYLHQFLLVMVVLVSMAVNVVTLVRGSKTQRREVSFSEEFVNKGQCSLMHGEFEKRMHKVESGLELIRADETLAMDSLRKEIKADISALHSRINEVLAAVAELRGELRRISPKDRL